MEVLSIFFISINFSNAKEQRKTTIIHNNEILKKFLKISI
jgi:hypothetical protein